MIVNLDLTMVSDDELLQQVKYLNDYGENTYADNKIRLLIRGCKNYMLGLGITQEIIESNSAVVAIACYVDCMSRGLPLNDYFNQQMVQFRVISNG